MDEKFLYLFIAILQLIAFLNFLCCSYLMYHFAEYLSCILFILASIICAAQFIYSAKKYLPLARQQDRSFNIRKEVGEVDE